MHTETCTTPPSQQVGNARPPTTHALWPSPPNIEASCTPSCCAGEDPTLVWTSCVPVRSHNKKRVADPSKAHAAVHGGLHRGGTSAHIAPMPPASACAMVLPFTQLTAPPRAQTCPGRAKACRWGQPLPTWTPPPPGHHRATSSRQLHHCPHPSHKTCSYSCQHESLLGQVGCLSSNAIQQPSHASWQSA
jgi:hypothetical protein